MFLHEFAHIDTDHGVLSVKQEFGQSLREFRLTDACRTEEEEGTIRTVRVGQAGTRTKDGVNDFINRFFLSDNALADVLGHIQKFLAFAFHHLGDRNTGCAGNHFGDFFSTYLCTQELRFFVVELGFFFFFLHKLFFKFRKFAVLDRGEFFILAGTAKLFHLGLELVDFVTDFFRTQGSVLFFLPDFFQIGILAA